MTSAVARRTTTAPGQPGRTRFRKRLVCFVFSRRIKVSKGTLERIAAHVVPAHSHTRDPTTALTRPMCGNGSWGLTRAGTGPSSSA